MKSPAGTPSPHRPNWFKLGWILLWVAIAVFFWSGKWARHEILIAPLRVPYDAAIDWRYGGSEFRCNLCNHGLKRFRVAPESKTELECPYRRYPICSDSERPRREEIAEGAARDLVSGDNRRAMRADSS